MINTPIAVLILVGIIFLALVGIIVMLLLHIHRLVNKVMSRNYGEYLQSEASVNIMREERPDIKIQDTTQAEELAVLNQFVS